MTAIDHLRNVILLGPPLTSMGDCEACDKLHPDHALGCPWVAAKKWVEREDCTHDDLVQTDEVDGDPTRYRINCKKCGWLSEFGRKPGKEVAEASSPTGVFLPMVQPTEFKGAVAECIDTSHLTGLKSADFIIRSWGEFPPLDDLQGSMIMVRVLPPTKPLA